MDIENKQKIENISEIEKHTRIVIDKIIKPFNGHITFEINDVNKTITIAELSVVFIEVPKSVHWFDIINNDFGKEYVVIKKANCRYESRLNLENLLKKVKGISGYTYVPKKHNAGSFQNISVKYFLK